MTRRYWDSQFNFREILPDFQACLESMDRRSAQGTIDFDRVNYGPHSRQFVELTGTPRGVLPVFIHGGYWRALTAQMHRFVLPPLLESHGAVANLEYRLLPEVSLDAIIQDALSGLKKIAALTGSRLLVIGHSAGGHLAVMSALRCPETVIGAASISGLYDLTPLPWTFLHDEVGLRHKHLTGLGPQHAWNAAQADHVMVAVGAHETPEFHRQAHVFASTHGAGVFTVPGAHHMTVLDAMADPASTLNAAIQTLSTRAATRNSISDP